MFFLVNAQGDVATATVVNGQATVWELFQGSGCSLIGTLLGSVPGSAVDSPAAVSAGLSDGGTGAGTKFMSAHPGGYLTASLWTGGAWYVDYTTCPATGNGTTGTTYYQYSASVDFTSGKIIGTGTSGTTKCSGLDITGGFSNLGARSLSGVLAVGGVVVGSSYTGSGTTYFPWYISIQSAGAGLTAQDLGFKLVSAFLATEPFAFVGLVGITGCWVGSSLGPGGLDERGPDRGPSSATACTGSPSLTSPLSAGDQLALETSSSDSGNIAAMGAALEINDVSGSYSGVVVATIP